MTEWKGAVLGVEEEGNQSQYWWKIAWKGKTMKTKALLIISNRLLYKAVMVRAFVWKLILVL